MKEQLLKECERQIGKALSDALTSYNSPLISAVKESLLDVEPQIKSITNEAVGEIVADAEFKDILKKEIKKKVAKTLIARIGGEIESTVNKLKSDPTTRARITVAIDSVIGEITK